MFGAGLEPHPSCCSGGGCLKNCPGTDTYFTYPDQSKVTLMSSFGSTWPTAFRAGFWLGCSQAPVKVSNCSSPGFPLGSFWPFWLFSRLMKGLVYGLRPKLSWRKCAFCVIQQDQEPDLRSLLAERSIIGCQKKFLRELPRHDIVGSMLIPVIWNLHHNVHLHGVVFFSTCTQSCDRCLKKKSCPLYLPCSEGVMSTSATPANLHMLAVPAC